MATWSATGRAGRQPASASVVRRTTASAPSARCRTTTVVPAGVPGGGHRLQGAGQDQERVGRCRSARRSRPGRRPPPAQPDPSFLTSAGDGSPVHAGHDQPPDVAGLQAGRLQRPGQGILAQSQVAVLAEPLLPELGGPVARRPPAVGELVGGRGGGHELGQDSGPVPDERGGPGIAAGGLVGAGGQPVAQVPGDHQVGPAAPQRGNEAAHARSAARRRSRRRRRRPAGAGRPQPRWRWSCRGRRARRWRTRANRGCAPAPSAGPAGPPRPRAWWCPRRATPRRGCPCRRRCP